MNRKRVLWPLLLVAAFGLGVLAAQVQAGAIFLPLVAKASTGEETPTPGTQGTVTVENVSWHHTDSEFYGELVNETGCPVSAPTVAMYLLDEDGLITTQRIGHSMAPILWPGERTPFVVRWYASHPAHHSYLIYPQWEPIERLTVETEIRFNHGAPMVSTLTTLHNQLPVRVESVALGLVLYGPSGEVAAYDSPRPIQVSLDPGDTLGTGHVWQSYDLEPGVTPVACAAFAIPSGGSYLSLMNEGDD